MARNTGKTRNWNVIALTVLALALAPAARVEAVTVDGRVTSSDGYTIIKSLSFTVEGAPGTHTGATLRLDQAGNGDMFAAFSLPKTLVDNSYGDTRIGWGGAHKFQQLVSSDKAQFIFRDMGGTPLLNVTFDYLHADGKDVPPPYVADKTAKDFNVDVGSPDDVLAASSSLFYNWVTFGAGYPQFFGKDVDSPAADANYDTTDPALSGWVYDVTYEFKISGALAIDWLSNDAVEIVHASPNKIGGKRVKDFTVTDTTVVPEPLTVFGVVLGVGGLARYVRRRLA